MIVQFSHRGIVMFFDTVLLNQSASYWGALCLENAIVGQGITQADAINKLQEEFESFQQVTPAKPGFC